jgi:hypothetical protein
VALSAKVSWNTYLQIFKTGNASFKALLVKWVISHQLQRMILQALRQIGVMGRP